MRGAARFVARFVTPPLAALGRLLGATFGRRLMVRLWAHGVLLFVGVLATVLVGRHMMSRIDDASYVRGHPYLAVATAERVLARRDDPARLARELERALGATAVDFAVYDGAGALLGETAPGLATPPTAEERATVLTREPPRRFRHSRMVVGVVEGGALAAACVIIAPRPPTLQWHLVVLLASSLLLAFVFVAAPLAYSIARPIAHLGRLARELGAGDLAVRAGWRRHDELGDLARAFDTMAGQLQNLRAAERQLLGDVSHELRTPLARMRVVLDLADTADLDRVRRYLAEITADLGELEQLIDDIIASARLDPAADRWEEARPPLRVTRLPARQLVDAAAQRFRGHFPARRLTVSLPDDAPDDDDALEVEGDPAMLRRALDNLLDNARKYSPDDAEIELRLERDDEGPGARSGRSVRVAVVDRGAGIAAIDQPRVFTPFFRADRSRTRSSGGVGLGLTLARRIVEAHGGALGFESAEGRGSRFWFTLPLAPPPAPEPRAQRPRTGPP